jgi:hypothetical protein
MGGTQPFTCVEPPALPAEPLAVDEMGAGELDADTASRKPLDGVLIEIVGILTVGQ